MFKLNPIILLSLVISQPLLAADPASSRASTPVAKPNLHQPTQVFEQQHIKSYGVSNVYNLLNYVPGFQSVVGSNQSAHNKLQIRGVSADSGYIVLMVDGVKINTLLSNNVLMNSPYFDLTLAQRVEVYTGPNAVRFGNNAVLAVINVITKKSNHVSLELGSDHHTKGSASLSRKTSYGELSFYIMNAQGDGGEYSSDNIPTSRYLTNKNYMNKPYEYDQLNASWQVGNYILSYYREEQEQDGFLNNQSYYQGNQFNAQTQFISNQYHKKINDKLSFKTDLTFSEHKVKSVALLGDAGIRPFSEEYWFGSNLSAIKTEFNFTGYYTWSNSLSLEFGTQWQEQEQDEAAVITSHLTGDNQSSLPLDRYYLGGIKTISEFGEYANLLQRIESHGLFSNLDWTITPMDYLSAGIRLERNHGFSDDVSTQLTYTRVLNEKSNITAQYSEAFRSPNFYELFSENLLAYGNSELEPEKIRAYELSYDYTATNWSGRVTSFYQQQSKVIGLDEVDSELGNTYRNRNDKDMFGVTVKGEHQFNPMVKLEGTFTHYFNDTEDYNFQTFGSVGLITQIDGFTIGLNTVIRSGVKVTSNTETVFKEDPVMLVNAVVNYQLGRSILFSLKLENAFDQQHNVYDSSQIQNQFYVTQPTKFVAFSITYEL
jgi:iron complex outermembrane receptor protein